MNVAHLPSADLITGDFVGVLAIFGTSQGGFTRL